MNRVVLGKNEEEEESLNAKMTLLGLLTSKHVS